MEQSPFDSKQDFASFYSPEEVAAEQQRFLTKVFSWMAFALAITGVVAWWTAQTPAVMNLVFSSRLGFYALLGAEIGLVMWISSSIERMSAQRATFLYVVYAVLNGLTLSVVFMLFTQASIASTFYITAGMFGAMSLYGYTTKKDLSGWGSILIMGVVGLIIASVVNMFLNSTMLYWITSYVGVFIFAALTAYDMQKIKEMNIIGNEGTEEDHKEAIMGALTLYLDFINLFLYLLRIFGNRK